MKIPAEPRIGSLISYSYLWADEATEGRTKGTKTRPAAIVMARSDIGPVPIAYVLAITHVPPGPGDALRKLEIPARVKSHLGMDESPSCVVLDELNVFAWPGFDLRAVPRSTPPTCIYGVLPTSLFEDIRQGMLGHMRGLSLRVVKRRE
jgi:hypothetical protein